MKKFVCYQNLPVNQSASPLPKKDNYSEKNWEMATILLKKRLK